MSTPRKLRQLYTHVFVNMNILIVITTLEFCNCNIIQYALTIDDFPIDLEPNGIQGRDWVEGVIDGKGEGWGEREGGWEVGGGRCCERQKWYLNWMELVEKYGWMKIGIEKKNIIKFRENQIGF